MTTLREVRNNWHLLLDKEIPRLREGLDVQILWGASYYDGPASGVCTYLGERYWFDRISGGCRRVKYRGLEIENTIYAIVDLTAAEFGLEKAVNNLFRAHVGEYCNYTYKVYSDGPERTLSAYGPEEDPDEREYQRVRGTASVQDTKAGYETYSKLLVENQLTREFGRYFDRPVIGWWAH